MIKTEYKKDAPVAMTIALVSDLHECDSSEVIQILKSDPPDLIVIPGDLFENHYPGENLDLYDHSRISRMFCRMIHLMNRINGRNQNHSNPKTKKDNCYRLLREASKLAPVIMTLGNHELYLTDQDLPTRIVWSRTGALSRVSSWYI